MFFSSETGICFSIHIHKLNSSTKTVWLKVQMMVFFIPTCALRKQLKTTLVKLVLRKQVSLSVTNTSKHFSKGGCLEILPSLCSVKKFLKHKGKKSSLSPHSWCSESSIWRCTGGPEVLGSKSGWVKGSLEGLMLPNWICFAVFLMLIACSRAKTNNLPPATSPEVSEQWGPCAAASPSC